MMIRPASGMQTGRVVAFSGSSRNQPVDAVRFSAARRREDPALLSVSGSGTVEKMPDTMRIWLSVQEQGPNREAVNTNLNRKAEQLMDAIKALHLPSTVKLNSSFSPLHRTYDYSGQKTVAKGYQGNFSLNIVERGGSHEEFPKHAAAIRDVAGGVEGANFNGPSYELSNRDEAELEALGKAVASARQKAQAVAGAGGFELEERPHSVEVGQSEGDVYRGGGARAFGLESMAAGRGAQPVSEDVFKIAPIVVSSENVKVRFKIKA